MSRAPGSSDSGRAGTDGVGLALDEAERRLSQ